MNPMPQEVHALLQELSRYALVESHVEVGDRRATIYTNTNRYTISYRVPSAPLDRDGYLGCVAVSRTPRAGEDWCRGNDLHDGPFTAETWHRILADIVSYEMVKVHRPKNTVEIPTA